MQILSSFLDCVCQFSDWHIENDNPNDLGPTPTFHSEVMRVKSAIQGIITWRGTIPSQSIPSPVVEEPLSKKVRFSRTLEGVLIPTKDELREYTISDKSLANSLWYTKEERQSFAGEAAKEVAHLMPAAEDSLGKALGLFYRSEPALA